MAIITYRTSLVGAKTVGDIAEVLGVNQGQLLHILYKYPVAKKYRVFDVKKKSGGVRKIHAAKGGLKIFQDKLYPLIYDLYRPKAAVHGFIKGKSIVTNAQCHKRKSYVFNIDLDDFYGTINFGRVRGLFMAWPFNMAAPAASVMAQICTVDNSLPQGASTSPIISNFIASGLDKNLVRLAKKHNLTYTRYADDITFSTTKQDFPKEIAHHDGVNPVTGDVLVGNDLENAITSSGFKINSKKTRLQIKPIRQSVTGITVNEFPNVSRKYIRNIRAFIHAWEKYGAEKVEQYYREKYAKNVYRFDNSKLYFKESLYGKLEFLKMVRGIDSMYVNFCLKLAQIDTDPPKIIRDMKMMHKEYDVFISHASEDKDSVARPISEACKALGLVPFFDEAEIKWGDSLPEVINHALGKSSFFLAVLSSNSIDKAWPKREVNAAFARKINGNQVFLPLMVGEGVSDQFPLASDILHIKWTDNADEIAQKILELKQRYSNSPST